MPPVVVDQAIAQRLVGDRLERGRDGRADRQAALIKEWLAVLRDQLAAHLLDEIVGADHLGRRALTQDQRLRAGPLGLGPVDGAVVEHASDHPIAPRFGGLGAALGVVPGRRLGQTGKERRFARGQLVERLVEIIDRRRGHAVRADAEVDLIEVEFENLILGERPLHAEGEQRLLDLALDGHLVAQQEVLGDLLGDRRGADRAPVGHEPGEVGDRGAHDAQRVDARMRVEILVLGREERLNHALRNRLDRHEHPLLVGELGQQSAVAGVQTGHRRRLVVGQLPVVRQARAVTVHQEQRASAGDQGEHQRPGAQRPEQLQQSAQPDSSTLALRSPPGLHGRASLVRRILLRNKDRSRAPPRRPVWRCGHHLQAPSRRPSSTGTRARPAPRACRAT